MRSRCSGLVRSSFATLSLVISHAPQLRAQGTPIGFAEDFALASDRAGSLAKLIPGTEEHFFYSCLLAQHESRFDDVTNLLPAWIERHGRTARVLEIENRQALLTWSKDPAAAARLLQDRLGLSFEHQRATQGVDPELPTRLDPALISAETLTRRALQRHPGSLDGFSDSALRALAAGPLDPERLTNLLQRLSTPDVPNLAALVVRQLRAPCSGPFGSLPIHRELFLGQLEECVRLIPALLDQPQFVAQYQRRLRPGADAPSQRDAAGRWAGTRHSRPAGRAGGKQ